MRTRLLSKVEVACFVKPSKLKATRLHMIAAYSYRTRFHVAEPRHKFHGTMSSHATSTAHGQLNVLWCNQIANNSQQPIVQADLVSNNFKALTGSCKYIQQRRAVGLERISTPPTFPERFLRPNPANKLNHMVYLEKNEAACSTPSNICIGLALHEFMAKMLQ